MFWLYTLFPGVVHSVHSKLFHNLPWVVSSKYVHSNLKCVLTCLFVSHVWGGRQCFLFYQLMRWKTIVCLKWWVVNMISSLPFAASKRKLNNGTLPKTRTWEKWWERETILPLLGFFLFSGPCWLIFGRVWLSPLPLFQIGLFDSFNFPGHPQPSAGMEMVHRTSYCFWAKAYRTILQTISRCNMLFVVFSLFVCVCVFFWLGLQWFSLGAKRLSKWRWFEVANATLIWEVKIQEIPSLQLTANATWKWIVSILNARFLLGHGGLFSGGKFAVSFTESITWCLSLCENSPFSDSPSWFFGWNRRRLVFWRPGILTQWKLVPYQNKGCLGSRYLW